MSGDREKERERERDQAYITRESLRSIRQTKLYEKKKEEAAASHKKAPYDDDNGVKGRTRGARRLSPRPTRGPSR